MPEGIFIAVVGPSGAGKDTLLTHASRVLSSRHDIHFARRVITRICDGITEDHDSLGAEAFESARRRGDFSISWDAHGLSYGLPASALDLVTSGAAVVANVSRATLEECASVFGRLAVLEITVDESALTQRIVARGREAGAVAMERAARMVATAPPADAIHIRIDNSHSLDESREAFVAALLSLRG